MTIVTMYRDKQGQYIGFKVNGHAGYAPDGEDIVCAAISALTITTMNSIETIVGEPFDYKEDQEKGLMLFRLGSTGSRDAQLLLRSMVLGLSQIQDSYPKYLKLKYKEV